MGRVVPILSGQRWIVPCRGGDDTNLTAGTDLMKFGLCARSNFMLLC